MKLPILLPNSNNDFFGIKMLAKLRLELPFYLFFSYLTCKTTTLPFESFLQIKLSNGHSRQELYNLTNTPWYF